MSISSISTSPLPGFTPAGQVQPAAATSGTPQSAAAAATATATAAPAVQETQQASASSLPPSMDQLQSAIKEVQQAIAPVAQELLFSIDNDSGRTVVKVMDTETNKVLRQFPTEEVLQMAKALDKLQGLLLKQTA